MTSYFNQIHLFVVQSVNPVYLLNRSLSNIDFEKWKAFLLGEGEALRLQMMVVLFGTGLNIEKREYLSGIQQQLVMMSDIVNRYLFKDKKVWMSQADAELIKANYLMSLAFFQEQLVYSEQQYASYYDQEVKITDFCLRDILPQLRHQIYALKENLQKHRVGTEIIDIVIKGLSDLFGQRQLSPANVAYITGLVKEFEKYSYLVDDTVISILIKWNFNRPDFYLYVTKSLNERLIQINGLHEQKELILQHKDHVRTMDNQAIFSFHPGERHIKDEILDFFSEKSSYLDELMALRRLAINDKYTSEKAFRMLVGLSVPQLALFFRMQMESGVLSKQAKQELFNFVAHHFYTENTVFISSQNLSRLSTVVEFSTALKLWDILTEMKEWLDRNFSVSIMTDQYANKGSF